MNWSQLLGLDPTTINDLRYVGYTYLKEGHYQIAIEFFEALIILEPSTSYNYQTLGALYLQTGQLQLALNYLERSLKIDPQHEPTRLNKLKTLYLLGYFKQANLLAQELIQSASLQAKTQAEALFLAYS
jgi:tetratricopeptide (TPR) repeat protein